MKLFTKEIDKKLFQQYPYGSDLASQKVVAKIFNPYGRGTWYLLNSDPADPDYLWAIVDLFEVEIGSVSRTELESIKVKPFGLGLERDLYFSPINAMELYEGLQSGRRYANGGISDVEVIEKNNEAYLGMPQLGKGSTMVKLEHGGNLDMLKNQAVQFKHHAEELHNVLKNNPNVDAWVVAKAERASTDLSDITHYLEGSEKMANGGQLSIFEQGGGTFSNKIIYTHKYIPTMTLEVLDYTNKGVKGLQKDSKSLSKKERSNGIIVYYSDAEIKDLWQKKFADGGNILSEDTVARVDDPAFADLSMYAEGGVIDHYKEFDINKDGYLSATINSSYYEIRYRDDVSQIYDLYKDGKLIKSSKHLRSLFNFSTGGQLSMFEQGGNILSEDTVARVDDPAFADVGMYAKGGKSKSYMSGDEFREKLEDMSDEELLDYYVKENGFDADDEEHKERIEEERDDVIDELVEDYVRMMKSTGRFYAEGGELNEVKIIYLSDDEKLKYLIEKEEIEKLRLAKDRNERRNKLIEDTLKTTYKGELYQSIGYNALGKGHALTLDEAKKSVKILSRIYPNFSFIIKESIGNYYEKDITKKTFLVMSNILIGEQQLTNLKKRGVKFSEGGQISNGSLVRVKKYGWIMRVDKIEGNMYYLENDRRGTMNGNAGSYLASDIELVMAKGGEIEVGLGQPVTYRGELYEVTQKDGVTHLTLNKEGAWGSDYPMIPLSMVNQNELRNIHGQNVYIPYTFDKYAKGGGVSLSERQKDTLYNSWVNAKNKLVDLAEDLKKAKSRNDKDDIIEINKSIKRTKLSVSSFEKMMNENNINYAKGGKTKFKEKVASIKAKLLKNKKVPKAVQKDYGKTFSPAEAEDSAKRIAGAMRKKEMAKK